MPQSLFRHAKLILFLAATPIAAKADNYDLFSKHEELKGSVVVDAGDFEQIEPAFGKPDQNVVLKLKTNCVQPIGLIIPWGYSKKAGLLLVDQTKSIRVALFESTMGGSIKIDVILVTQMKCPVADLNGTQSDPQQQLLQIKRQQQLLQKQLEQLRQQQPKN